MIDIAEHEGLVVRVAQKFRFVPGVTFDELLAAGRVGVWEAQRRFDPARGFSFSTYAVYWIFQCISRWVYQTRFLVKVPILVQERIGRARQTGGELDPAARDGFVAQRTGTLHGVNGELLHDVAVAEREEVGDIEALRAAIERLPEREAEVVRGLFLEGKPVRAVSARLHISKTTLAKVRRRALRRLRGLLEAA